MLRNQAEEGSSGAMMFKSGGAVLKRGYVWNEIGIAATMCNLGLNNSLQNFACHLRSQREAGGSRRS
jgi:hypothetical protein